MTTSGNGSLRDTLSALALAAARVTPVGSVGRVSQIDESQVAVVRWSPPILAGYVVPVADMPAAFLPRGSGPATARDGEAGACGSLSHVFFHRGSQVVVLPHAAASAPSVFWITAAPQSVPLRHDEIEALAEIASAAAAGVDGVDSPDSELAQLRRLRGRRGALEVMTDVLDLRSVFERVSAVASRVLALDAISIPVISDDGQQVRAFATAGIPDDPYPSSRAFPEHARHLLRDPWTFEIVDDLDAARSEAPFDAALGYRSGLRVPVRVDGSVVALVVALARAPGVYASSDVPVARRVAGHVALALSHQRLADQARLAEDLRARTGVLRYSTTCCPA